MSTSVARQHIQDGADFHPRNRPQPRRQGTNTSETSQSLGKHNGRSTLAQVSTGAVADERMVVEREASESQGSGRPVSGLGKPPLVFSGTPVSNTLRPLDAQKKNRTGANFGLPAPFPTRGDTGAERDAARQPKAPVHSDGPSKASNRRLSATSRPGRSPSVVLRADMLDCSPWTGQHPEDRLTEAAIKGGYYEKAVVHNETNTARPSLWPHLKNGSGIQGLSTLFTTVLQRKEANGRVTASSSFKPPPRVTLTDTKRESWLKDLSNPSVPLRKLSRTIPHGIRGKALLEQCLAKQIPVTRAVWLARCVGANELRAFRRKGISGAVMVDNEIRWIKDWTSTVENFNQECIESREHIDWKTRCSYTMALTHRCYIGGLLDHDHFLGWVLDNIKQYTIHMALIAVVFVQTYWQELVKSLTYVRRIASGCIGKIKEICDLEENDLYDTVSEKFRAIMRLVLVHHPLSLLLPFDCKCLNEIITRAATGAQPRLTSMLRNLSMRNEKLKATGPEGHATSQPPQLALIVILDSLKAPFSFDRLSSSFLATGCALPEIILCTLHWASSVYRVGRHRCYIAAALLRDLLRTNPQANDHLLPSLATFRCSETIDFRCLARVIVELIRSKDFDAGQYLRWLIANGASSSSIGRHSRPSSDAQILHDMPLNDMSQATLSLRQMILSGMSWSDNSSSDTALTFKREIDQELRSSKGHCIVTLESKLAHPPQCMGIGELYAIGELLGRRIVLRINDPKLHRLSVVSYDGESQQSPFLEVLKLLQILEVLGDFKLLAELLLPVIKISDGFLLSWLAPACERMFDILYSIFPSTRISTQLIQRYRFLRLTGPPIKEIAESLLRITTRFGGSDVTKYLEHEVSMSDVTLAVAAYTPLSDLQLEGLQSSNSEFDDDIEHMIATISTLDEKIMGRVLDMVASRTDSITSGMPATSATFRPLLWKLRSTDEKLFAKLSMDWLFMRLAESQGRAVACVLLILSQTSCLTFGDFLLGVEDKCKYLKTSTPTLSAQLAVAVLEVAIPISGEEHSYADKFSFCSRYPRSLLRFLHHALALPVDEPGRPNERVRCIFTDEAVIEALYRSLSNDAAFFQSELDLPSLVQDAHGIVNVQALVTSLLDPKGYLGIQSMTPDAIVRKLFSTSDAFALPSYRLGLQFFASSALHIRTGELDVTSAALEACKTAMLGDSLLWPLLISGFDTAMKADIRSYAEKAIFEALGKPSEIFSVPELNAESLETLKRHLGVVASTADSIQAEGSTDVAQLLIQYLNALAQHMPSEIGQHAAPASIDADAHVLPGAKSLHQRTEILLRLCIIHIASFRKSHQETALLPILCRLLIHNTPQLPPAIIEHILDITAYFSADLSPSELTTIHDSLGILAPHPLIRYIFGFRKSPDSWLHLTNMSTASTSSTFNPVNFNEPATNTRQLSLSIPPLGQPAQRQQQSSIPYPLRHWELLSDSTPNIGINDTALSLRLFDARRV